MKYKIIFKDYDNPDEIMECETLEEIEQTIKHFYLHDSDVCIGEFLDFVEVQGVSINEVFDIKAHIMFDIEGDVIDTKEV